MVKIGNKVKNFSHPATGDKTISLNDLTGKKVVLYFYPKDSTPGCTTEGQDFRDSKASFTKQNTVILGVSRDSMKKHENFKTNQKFNLLKSPIIIESNILEVWELIMRIRP